MPTNSQMVRAGKGREASVLAKRGGFDAWASRLGLLLSRHDSRTGWAAEERVATMALRVGCSVTPAPRVKHPWDLLINGHRIDVKSGQYAEYGVCKGWFFQIRKIVPTCDFYVLTCLVGDECERLYIIPAMRLQQTSVTISAGAKRFTEYQAPSAWAQLEAK